MRSLKAPTIVLLFCFLCAGAPAQERRQTEVERERQRERLQAATMIKQTAAEAPGWSNKKSAVEALADAADLLWDETPVQGARWVRKAWSTIEQVPNSAKDQRLKVFFTRSDQSELRTVVLSVARRHDPKLAEQLLREMSDKKEDEKKERGAFDDRTARSEQLLSMAQQLLDSNPEEAFALAANSLTDGVSFSLQNILASLRNKSVPLANQLFDLALARFNHPQPDPSEAQVLAGYLFRPGLTFSVSSSGQNVMVLNPAHQNLPIVAAIEPDRAKAFLVAVYERLLAAPVAVNGADGAQRAQQILALGNLVASRYQTFAPELAQSAQGFLAQMRQQLTPESESTARNSTPETRSSGEETSPRPAKEGAYEKLISELEDNADKEGSSAFRDIAYLKAAVATKPQDYVRGKRIAEKIDEKDLREDAVSFVLYRGALSFVAGEEFEKAADLAPSIKDALRRAVVRIALAQRLLSSKPGKTTPDEANLVQQRALDLLNDADRDLKKGDPSPNTARILLGKTALLAALDKEQALTSLAQAIQIINKLEEFDLRHGVAPSLGVNAAPNSSATVNVPRIGFDFRSAIDPLIETHFDDVSALTGRFATNELSGLARLEAARLYLRKSGPAPLRESSAVIR